MRFSVFTASTPDWTPEQAVLELAAQGWHGIEWRIVDQEDTGDVGFWAGNKSTWPLAALEDNLETIARLGKEAGLEISGIGGYALHSERDDVERLLAATAMLGADKVRIRLPRLAPDEFYPTVFARTRADFEWVSERAAHHGVKALVELHHGTATASASAARRLIEGLDPMTVGVIHDLGNLVIEGREGLLDPLVGLEILGEYLAHVHIKNAAWTPASTREDGTVDWVNGWATLKKGQADVFGYLAALHRVGYDGWVTLEDFSTELPLRERSAGNLEYVTAAARAAGYDIDDK